jgi:hypothetical protein
LTYLLQKEVVIRAQWLHEDSVIAHRWRGVCKVHRAGEEARFAKEQQAAQERQLQEVMASVVRAREELLVLQKDLLRIKSQVRCFFSSASRDHAFGTTSMERPPHVPHIPSLFALLRTKSRVTVTTQRHLRCPDWWAWQVSDEERRVDSTRRQDRLLEQVATSPWRQGRKHMPRSQASSPTGPHTTSAQS